MACPFMAGIVALMLAKHKKQEFDTGKNDCRTIDEIKEHLRKYTMDKGRKGKDNSWGYGVIDVADLILENYSSSSSSKSSTSSSSCSISSSRSSSSVSSESSQSSKSSATRKESKSRSLKDKLPWVIFGLAFIAAIITFGVMQCSDDFEIPEPPPLYDNNFWDEKYQKDLK